MWSTLIPAAASIIGGLLGNRSADRAANAQAQASQAAIAEQQRQYDQARQDSMPWLRAGQNALTGQQALLNGDYSGFQNSPDYQYALNQGLQGLDRSAAAHGALYSGGHQADLVNYAQGLATQHLNAYWNRLAGLSEAGRSSSAQLAGMGRNYATDVGHQLNNAAQMRGWAYNKIGDNTTDAIAAAGNAFGQWYGDAHPAHHGAVGNTTGNPYENNAYISDPYRRNQWYLGRQPVGY
ncbi:MAG TPA: hypothetical protein ACQGQG_10645 [Xylella sp.]